MLLERLRCETRAQHEQLESVVGLAPDRAAHEAQLRNFLGFVQPWERAIGDSRWAAWWKGREKTGWLRADLIDCGLTASAVDALPRCAEMPSLATEAEVLGSIYVMEGSTLGGQMISRHLESALGFSDGVGYRYFRSYGTEVGRRWGEFRAILLAASSGENDDAIVASAGRTFDALHRWFAGAERVVAG